MNMTAKYELTPQDKNDIRNYLSEQVQAYARAHGHTVNADDVSRIVDAIRAEQTPYIARWRASANGSAGLNAAKRMWEQTNKAQIAWTSSANGDSDSPSPADGEDASAGMGEDGSDNGNGQPSDGAVGGMDMGTGHPAPADEGDGDSDNGQPIEGEGASEDGDAEDGDSDNGGAGFPPLFDQNALLKALADFVNKRIAESVPNIDTSAIAEEVAKILKENGTAPTESISIDINGATSTVGGLVHPKFPRVLAYLASGENVYLHGPAGTGKSTMAEQLGTALKLPVYYYQALLSKYDILGRNLVDGTYVPSEFYKAFTEGGVVLVDEMDASAPEAIVAINTALANHKYSFPTGTVNQHPDFHFIGAGNTIGKGADAEMTGRFALDQASLDRFRFVYIGYDHRILLATANGDEVLTKYFEDVQKIVKDKGISLAVTPRSIKGIVKSLDYLEHPAMYNIHIPNGMDGLQAEDYIRAILLNENLYKGADIGDIGAISSDLHKDNGWVRATRLLATGILNDGFEA